MAVARLGALAFNTTDVDAWHRLLVDLLGMEPRPRASESDPLLVRYDDHEHRIALYPSDENSVRLISWDVDSPEQLDELAERIEKAGYPVERLSHGENATRDWAAAIRFDDPEGTPTEIRYGATLDHREFRPSGVVGGFVTGELGMGHVVLHCGDYAGTVDFYTNVLGFKLSDYIVWDEADATFFHVNGRHHSLALMNTCFGTKPGQFNHFMIELEDLDDTGRAYDLIVKKEGYQVTMDFGRHTNDGVTSFYIKTPNGFQLELGSGGVIVDDDNWKVETWRAPMRWGHQLIK
jgi:extradiol dioxygenase